MRFLIVIQTLCFTRQRVIFCQSMKPFVLLILSLFAFSCDNSAPQTAPKPVYFDVAGYVKSQIETLSARKPTVAKNAFINKQSNTQTTKAIDWAKELELFLQADINKPAFRNSYTIARPDSLTYKYALKPTEEKLTVRFLTVKLDSKTGKPVQIKALLKSENRLYESERRLLIESGVDGKIQHYRVEGFQQLTYFDRNEFRVEGQISPVPAP